MKTVKNVQLQIDCQKVFLVFCVGSAYKRRYSKISETNFEYVRTCNAIRTCALINTHSAEQHYYIRPRVPFAPRHSRPSAPAHPLRSLGLNIHVYAFACAAYLCSMKRKDATEPTCPEANTAHIVCIVSHMALRIRCRRRRHPSTHIKYLKKLIAHAGCRIV